MSKELKEERMKILELLSKKVISAEEAEKLLASLNQDDEEKTQVVNKKSQFRMLKILVNSADGDNVNITVPIEFAKLLKNKKFLNNYEDQFDFDIDELIEMVNSGADGELVNINSADGDTVRIVVE
ncbi:MAG: SHOCT-like domain-containing protein [Bacillota bacterium]